MRSVHALHGGHQPTGEFLVQGLGKARLTETIAGLPPQYGLYTAMITPVVAALFEAYFVKGQDIGDSEVLKSIAEKAELDVDMVDRLLTSDSDLKDISDRDAHARAKGVTGVPTFVVGNQHVVPGAQPPELWERVITELLAQPEQ